MANNQLLASDNFASGSLAAGWSAWPGLSESAVVLGSPNVTQPSTTSATQGEYWTGTSFPPDHICEVTVQNLNTTGAAAISLAVRFSNASGHSQGYEAIVNLTNASNKVTIYRLDAGTPTQIAGTGAAAITVVAGDVFTFAAIGACLVVYQNGKRLLYIGDATYVSGSVGMFVQSNSGNANSAQISSFRGYSVQQQDGIWTKKGSVLPATSAELALNPSGNTGFLGLSFGPARFLTGNVYRGYFAYGTHVGYAESVDGITWSRYPSNPLSTLAGYVGVDAFFYNGTYYLWAQATQGSSTATLFTSTDGLTWANQGNTDLPSGSGTYYGLHIADVIGGVFYGLFSKLATGSGYTPSTFLATSSNGINWTVQNGGNAVIAGTFCGFQIYKSGGKYYFWATQNQPGQGNATAPNFDPCEAVRYSSSDLMAWVAETHSLHNALLSDSFNNSNAGVAATSIINIGGKAYLYYQGSPGDSTGPDIYQTMLAIAPVSIEQIIANGGSETAQPQVASDPFTNGPGDLSGNWITPTGFTKLTIAAGPVVEASAQNTDCCQLYTGAGFLESQYSQVVIHTLSGARQRQYIFPVVLGQSNAKSFYAVELTIATGSISTGADFCILKKVAGVNTILSGSTTPNNITLSVGDVIRLAATIGSDGSIILTVYQNGFQVLQAQDYSATFTSGYPGVLIHTTDAVTTAQISSWAGGNANVIPNYSAGSGDISLGPTGLGTSSEVFLGEKRRLI